MPRRSAPKLRRAVEFIRGGIRGGLFVPGEYLPPVSRLARQAGVSYVTMWKAVTSLKQRSILSGRPGHRLTIAGEPPPSSPGLNAGAMVDLWSTWRKVADDVHRDILQGTFQPGKPLPSQKELAAHYRVSTGSIRKALRHLCAQAAVVPRKKGYAVRPLGADRSSVKLVLLLYGHYPPVVDTGAMDVDVRMGTTDIEFIHVLENECAKARLGLDKLVFSIRGGTTVFTRYGSREQSELTDTRDTLGYLLPVYNRSCLQPRVLARLKRFGKPVALFDETGAWAATSELKSHPVFQVFAASISQTCARDVARYLLRLGHRRIAYISPFHGGSWSTARLRGLRDVHERTGLSDSVVAFTLPEYEDRLDFYSDAVKHADIESFRAFYDSWKSGVKPDFGRCYDPLMRHAMFQEFFSAEAHVRLRSLCREALKDKAVTCWVCANDWIAARALPLLSECKVAVPQHLSVISFDDSAGAVRNNFTSYNFNISAVVYAMMRFVLDFDRRRTKRKRPVVEINGRIVERMTTGPTPIPTERHIFTGSPPAFSRESTDNSTARIDPESE